MSLLGTKNGRSKVSITMKNFCEWRRFDVKRHNVAAILITYSLYSDGFICPVSNERLALDVEVIDQM